jgi:stalled ribosome alternative rescue factor ArfA
MLQIDNFKFKQMLDSSGLSISEKFDINNIFNCLSIDRKIEIIDNWPNYLNQILKIRNETQDKRRENIANALHNINNIVNDAILRQRDEEERKRKESLERQEINRSANTYDQMKR